MFDESVMTSPIRRKPEVGERAVSVKVRDQLDHAAIAHVEELRAARTDLFEPRAARLALPSGPDDHEHALCVKRAIGVGFDSERIPRIEPVPSTICEFSHPDPLAGIRAVSDKRDLRVRPPSGAEIARSQPV
jgi:hypothetical protein